MEEGEEGRGVLSRSDLTVAEELLLIATFPTQKVNWIYVLGVKRLRGQAW